MNFCDIVTSTSHKPTIQWRRDFDKKGEVRTFFGVPKKKKFCNEFVFPVSASLLETIYGLVKHANTLWMRNK